nr:hypothetical protein [uncultured Acetatifactor sp.]
MKKQTAPCKIETNNAVFDKLFAAYEDSIYLTFSVNNMIRKVCEILESTDINV